MNKRRRCLVLSEDIATGHCSRCRTPITRPHVPEDSQGVWFCADCCTACNADSVQKKEISKCQ
jgi:hypothetical protein